MNKLLLVVASFVIGCSLANREGIEASCEELDDGTKNVCREGIITACIGGEIQYRVCEDEKSCEAQWQTKGSYRCNQGDPVDTVPPKEEEPKDGPKPTTDACGWSFDASTCAACIETTCCEIASECKATFECSSCTERSAAAPCEVGLVPLFDQFNACQRSCGCLE